MHFIPYRRGSGLVLSMACLAVAEGACIPSALPVSGDTTLMNFYSTTSAFGVPHAIGLADSRVPISTVSTTSTRNAVSAVPTSATHTVSAGAAAGTPKNLVSSSTTTTSVVPAARTPLSAAQPTTTSSAKAVTSSSTTTSAKISTSSTTAIPLATTSAPVSSASRKATSVTTTTSPVARVPIAAVTSKPITTTTSTPARAAIAPKATTAPVSQTAVSNASGHAKRHIEAPDRFSAAGRAILRRQAEESQDAELAKIAATVKFSTHSQIPEKLVKKVKFSKSSLLKSVHDVVDNLSFSRSSSSSEKKAHKVQHSDDGAVVARLQFGTNSPDPIMI